MQSHVMQISYASSSPRLSNGSIYFNYFRVIPSETHIHKGQVSLVLYFGWERVALVNQYESLFVEVRAHVFNLFTFVCYMYYIAY